MKTEVYSWRVSADMKSALEREARRRKMSLSGVLDAAAREWLTKNMAEKDDEEEQARIRREALKFAGVIKGGDSRLSENSGVKVKEILRRKYGR